MGSSRCDVEIATKDAKLRFVECQSPNVRSIEVKFRNLSFHTFKYLEFT